MTRRRLLYLGFAFPPGVQALHPHLNPAGHRFETRMIAELRKAFDVRSVGVLPVAVPPQVDGNDPASGIMHALTLEDRPPRTLHRWRSLLRLRRAYASWRRAGWQPDAVLTYNLSPIYNAFVRDLDRAAGTARPKRVLLLLDSSQLGRALPWGKRIRYRLKPLVYPDAEMLPRFDGCIGLSPDVQKHFLPSAPFLWMPGACPANFGHREANDRTGGVEDRPVRFGYFGALAGHAGIVEFAEVFLATRTHATLRVCGYGKLSNALASLASTDARLEFHGLLPTPDDCLEFGRSCDVLVNPRPATHGNENNFPSKIFEYACCGRAILTTGLSGVERVLGDDASFFDARRFRETLAAILPVLAATPIIELRRRGGCIRERVAAEYNWPRQGGRISEFIEGIINGETPA